jgi:F0F1-type ATP synthase delta subunit
VPFLTIEKALDPEQHPDFIRLRNESETYARAAANAAVERNELIELRAEMEKMKEKATSEQNVEDGFKNYIQNDPELLEILLKKLKEGMVK